MLLRSIVFAALSAFLLILPGNAQHASPRAPYTLRSQVREVLTDVTVTDAKGNPVTGLPESAFHIYDNGHPQTLASFVASAADSTRMSTAPSAPGVYTNEYLRHPPAVFNVILLDVTTMGLVDQMVLNQQLIRFVRQLPSSEPVAVFARTGAIITEMQDFTTDHALLLAAIRKAIPRIRPPGFPYENDFDALMQMAAYLDQYPGRKNLLWFSGGSNLFLFDTADPATLPDLSRLRPVYDRLETERIALYPIDVRGLTVYVSQNMISQQMLMRQQAETTGGHAFVDTNGLGAAAAGVVNDSGDFYTLTYSPTDVRFNNRWHKVRITVDGGYHLSYRHGYFDDGTFYRGASHKARKVLRASGKIVQVPSDSGDPLLFSARVIPGTLALRTDPVNAGTPQAAHRKRGDHPYTVRFELPVHAFYQEATDPGHSRITLGAAILAFDNNGEPVARQLEQAKLTLTDSADVKQPAARFPFDELIYLPKGDDYLFLAVWDTTTGRMGTLNVPLKVTRR